MLKCPFYPNDRIKRALKKTKTPWTKVMKDSVSAFHGIVNSTDPTFRIIDSENSGQIVFFFFFFFFFLSFFLDTLVTSKNGAISIDVSHRYLYSQHEKEQKQSAQLSS